MRSVPFGGYARNEREGGGYAEPGVRCVSCGASAGLRVVAYGVYHCTDLCEWFPEAAPRRRRKDVWSL